MQLQGKWPSILPGHRRSHCTLLGFQLGGLHSRVYSGSDLHQKEVSGRRELKAGEEDTMECLPALFGAWAWMVPGLHTNQPTGGLG